MLEIAEREAIATSVDFSYFAVCGLLLSACGCCLVRVGSYGAVYGFGFGGLTPL